MKLTNGKLLMGIGAVHTLLSFMPSVFLKQWIEFSSDLFINVSPHTLAPLTVLHYEKEAAFWFITWGVLLFFFGRALDFIETFHGEIPKSIKTPWLVFAVFCSVMLPASGFPILVLPQALWMFTRKSSLP